VIIADRDEQQLAVVDLPAERAVVDVSDPHAVSGLAAGIVARHGRLDVVFANAGIAKGSAPNDPSGVLDQFDLADYRELLEVNLHGVVHTVRAAAAVMKPRRSGSIVVTAPIAASDQ
jgi:NAD(P)-dependent dehydrogenase (short-subunit alcohol dehydrogenase family)